MGSTSDILKTLNWRVGFGLVGFVAIGCGSPPVKLPEQVEIDRNKEKSNQKTEVRMVQSGGGETTIFASQGVPAWSVKWEHAELDFELSESTFGGQLVNVQGVIFKDGKPASRYTAARAVVTRGSKILKLEGGAQVISTLNGQVRCNTAWYDGNTGYLRAEGGIDAIYLGYHLSGVSAVMASGNLDMIATPDLFVRKPGGGVKLNLKPER